MHERFGCNRASAHNGLQRDYGMAFMFISHNRALVQNFCDRVYSFDRADGEGA